MKLNFDKPQTMEYIKLARSVVEHESEVTNHRMIWTAAFHGLLFTALSFVWGQPDARRLISAFALLGISVSLLNTYALVMSSVATRHIMIWWTKNKPIDYAGPDIIGIAPDNPRSVIYYFAPWNILSFLFSFGWLAVFIINSQR